MIAERLRGCRAAMARERIPAYLITQRSDQIYLTGFNGEDGAVLITPREVVLITDGRFDEAAERQAPWAARFLRGPHLTEGIAEVAGQHRVKSMAVQPEHMTLAMLDALGRACRGIRITQAPPIASRLRRIKDRTEIGLIRHSIAVAEGAFKATRKALRPRMTELEVAALLEYEMKKRGAARPSFQTIAAVGPNAALPHAEPGDRRLTANSMILLDWGAHCEGYCSDLTRVLFMGKISPRLKHVYQIVLDAQLKAIAAVAPGRRASEVDRVARDHIDACGYGDAFSHGLGHGLGLDIHEDPRLKRGFDDVLEPGMVVTIEPGIYLPGVGGVRIEDDVLVTSSGHEVLTTLNKTLRWATL